MSTNLEYRARERQRKRESGRQASQAQRGKLLALITEQKKKFRAESHGITTDPLTIETCRKWVRNSFSCFCKRI